MIILGSVNETVIDIETDRNCSGDTCSYTFSSDDITDSYSVAVEVVAVQLRDSTVPIYPVVSTCSCTCTCTCT